MTGFPGEKRAIHNKQATARLPHPNYNIDCIVKPAQALYNDSVSVLHVFSQISRAKQKFRALLKMDSIILYNFSGGHSTIRNKTPKYQE